MRQERNESWLWIYAQVKTLRKAGTEPTNNVKSKSGAMRSGSMSFCACRGSAE